MYGICMLEGVGVPTMFAVIIVYFFTSDSFAYRNYIQYSSAKIITSVRSNLAKCRIANLLPLTDANEFVRC